MIRVHRWPRNIDLGRAGRRSCNAWRLGRGRRHAECINAGPDRILDGVLSLPLTGRRRPGTTRASKRERQRAVLRLVEQRPVSAQHEIVALLGEEGYAVTQATVSRDISELGLVKVAHPTGHVYAAPSAIARVGDRDADQRLRRVLSDYPIRIGRSGLILLLISGSGTADAIAQAIDESSLQDQEGTLAGENTVLVLFADEDRLERWRARFESLQAEATGRGTDR
jgi:transcriptional regulator of arginine metabolism